jgi:hypothetical protein
MMSAWENLQLFPGEQPSVSRSCKALFSPRISWSPTVLASFWLIILTIIPFLVLIPGAWALVVWAAREPDSQSKLVEKLTTHEKDSLGIGGATLERGASTKEKAPRPLRG